MCPRSSAPPLAPLLTYLVVHMAVTPIVPSAGGAVDTADYTSLLAALSGR